MPNHTSWDEADSPYHAESHHGGTIDLPLLVKPTRAVVPGMPWVVDRWEGIEADHSELRTAHNPSADELARPGKDERCTTCTRYTPMTYAGVPMCQPCHRTQLRAEQHDIKRKLQLGQQVFITTKDDWQVEPSKRRSSSSDPR